MRRTSRLVLLFGIFLAALVFIVIIALNLTPGGGPTQATLAPTSAATLVAIVDIPLGTVVDGTMVETQTLSIGARQAGVLADPSQAIGQTARVPIKAGQQVLAAMFQVSDHQVLEVARGQRAIAIEVNQLTGVGSLINVGDSVDVVISLAGGAFPVVQVDAAGTITVVTGVNSLSVKLPLLLQDVQVLGVLDAPAAAAAQAAPQPSGGTTSAFTGAARLVILSVTPAQAEVIAFARGLNPEATVGNPDRLLSQVDLILRSPLDKGVTVTTDGVILKTLIDKYGVLPPQLVQTILPKR